MSSCKACGNEKVMLCPNCADETSAAEIERLRARVAELEALLAQRGELEVRVERLEIAMMPKPNAGTRHGSHLETVTKIMAESRGCALTAREIAARSGITTGAARMVLYTHKDRFVPNRLSKYRVKWTLKSTDAARAANGGEA